MTTEPPLENTEFIVTLSGCINHSPPSIQSAVPLVCLYIALQIIAITLMVVVVSCKLENEALVYC